jgi:hypothetical protein
VIVIQFFQTMREVHYQYNASMNSRKELVK